MIYLSLATEGCGEGAVSFSGEWKRRVVRVSEMIERSHLRFSSKNLPLSTSSSFYVDASGRMRNNEGIINEKNKHFVGRTHSGPSRQLSQSSASFDRRGRWLIISLAQIATDLIMFLSGCDAGFFHQLTLASLKWMKFGSRRIPDGSKRSELNADALAYVIVPCACSSRTAWSTFSCSTSTTATTTSSAFARLVPSLCIISATSTITTLHGATGFSSLKLAANCKTNHPRRTLRCTRSCVTSCSLSLQDTRVARCVSKGDP